MSLKTIEQVKKNRIFKPFDLIVYALLFVLIGGLFLAAFVKNKAAGDITGLEIKVKGVQVAVFSYEEKTLRQTSSFNGSCTLTEEKGGYRIIILTGEDGKNEMFIPKDLSVVKMCDANCSSDKDCTLMSIRHPLDNIICLPHELVISATTETLYIPDIIV